MSGKAYDTKSFNQEWFCTECSARGGYNHEGQGGPGFPQAKAHLKKTGHKVVVRQVHEYEIIPGDHHE